MPTFEAVPGNPWLMVLSIVSLGAFAGIAVFLLMQAWPRQASAVQALISEAQLLSKRRSGGALGPLMHVLPFLADYTQRIRGIDEIRADLSKNYARAGWPGGLTDEELLALSLLIGAGLALILAALFALYSPWVAPLGIIGLLLGPSLVSAKMKGQGKARDNSIIRAMPFVLDLLVLSLRAGTSLSVAMEIVARDYAGHPVGEEFRATLKDIEMGTTAKQAFLNLAARVPSIVVRTFVDEVIQSEELGRPIADTLERLSDRVRVNRVQDATEVAGKAKVLVLVPGMLVLLATLVVLFTPWIVKFKTEGVPLD